MTRFLLILFVVTTQLSAMSQHQTGLVPEDMRDMAALCTIYTFQDLYGDHSSMVPEGFEHLYSSTPTILDNKFDLFQKGDRAALVFRGSTANKNSWMVNLHSTLLPAKGKIEVNSKNFQYQFAEDTAAAVHAGYTLAIATMANNILDQISSLHDKGVKQLIITGHSQGGALAHLMRAYLEHLPKRKATQGLALKTYAFAAPMVGNEAFALEYGQKFSGTQSSYSIFETEDMVPNMPISLSGGEGLSFQGLIAAFSGNASMKDMASNSLFNLFGNSMTSFQNWFGSSVENQLEDAIGQVDYPEIRRPQPYIPLENMVELDPFDYPLILKDSTILENDSIMAMEERDAEGVFLNKALYRSAPSGFHHKPYNYYVGILKHWFPEDYQTLEVKVLPENL